MASAISLRPEAPTAAGQAQRLFDIAFAPERRRDPRSAAYRAGVMALLRLKLEGHRTDLPYAVGTAEADAYFSGQDEGNRIVRNLREGA